ncbi:unnamed protein product [Camellia sinensis]
MFGTNVGDVSIWEVGSRERLAHKPFKVWDLSACSMPLQTALVKDATISINRCIWGPDRSMCCFLKNIVQICTYNPTGELRQHLEYIFEGHEAPVYSVCPHYKENILFIFSTAIDGKIKAWLYDCLESRVDYDAPGLWCTAMAYSADGTRANMMRIIGLERDTISDSHLRMSRLESRNAWKKKLTSSFWKKFPLVENDLR